MSSSQRVHVLPKDRQDDSVDRTSAKVPRVKSLKRVRASGNSPHEVLASRPTGGRWLLVCRARGRHHPRERDDPVAGVLRP